MAALAHESSPALAYPPIATLAKYEKFDDWRAELIENGFVVVKGAVPKNRAAHYREQCYNWLRSFGTKIDFENPETWTSENLPIQNAIRAFGAYCVSHEKFMWDARMEPGVLDAFSKLWGTDELLVSFDCLNITFPNRRDLPARRPWEHIDQSPYKRGLHCVQGIIHLSPSGPEDGGLVVFPGSHKLNDEFFDTHPLILSPDKHPDISASPAMKDVYIFNKEELEWFSARGLRSHKVCAEPGDLILWDSRTIHYGSDPTERGNTIRTAVYATYMPAKLASSDQLALKKNKFESWGSTTHWPYEHIKPGPTLARLPDGTRDPRDRDQPLQVPELSDKLLKLAGAKPY
ncbi:hypothetical protein GQ53DRAFT_760542 [Thozetella sp. PMI_491]|nr:hypothetical protein GQ53DRAFT_760542 [Thozetella sp. PMI_491]